VGIICLLFLCLSCGRDAQQTQSAASAAEPVDLVVDLIVEEAWTMDAVANFLTQQTGIQFVLSPEIDPHKRMRDPYMVMLFDQNLKEHLDELEVMGLWSFTWKEGKYHIHEL
jgi:hypothetical protein